MGRKKIQNKNEKDSADKLKEYGNKAFLEQDYKQAIEYYT